MKRTPCSSERGTTCASSTTTTACNTSPNCSSASPPCGSTPPPPHWPNCATSASSSSTSCSSCVWPHSSKGNGTQSNTHCCSSSSSVSGPSGTLSGSMHPP